MAKKPLLTNILPSIQRQSINIDSINIDDFLPSIQDISNTRDSVWKWTPPSFHDFVHSKAFLNRPNLRNHIQEDGEIIFSGPNGAPICELFLDDEGLGSGKSTKMVVCAAYYITRLFHLRDIESYFNLESGISKLAIYNLAPNARVAADVVFNKLQTLLENIQWFRDNKIVINNRITSQIVFDDKPLVIRPGNSSRAFAVGYDTFFCMIDECAADEGFDTKNKDYFLDLFETANERRRSRFVKCPEKGLMFCVSSAGTEERYFEKLITEAEEMYADSPSLNPITDPIDHPQGRILYRRRSAFEANPDHRAELDAGDFFEQTITRQPRPNRTILYKVRIPNKWKRRYELNPAKLLRNMCAIPSLAISPFFTEWEKVLACVNMSGRTDPYKNKTDQYGYLEPVDPPSVWRDLPDNFHGLQGYLYYCHVDLGLSGDGCGLAIGHRGPSQDRGGSAFPSVVIDLSLCFQGSESNKIKIAEVKQFVIDMAKKRGFRFAKITFDNFQSVQTIQELQDLGFIVEKVGVKKSDFEVLMELLYDKRCDWYLDEWALGEAKRLEDKGNVVEKSMGSTDDEIECVARVCSEALMGEVPDSFVATRAFGFASKGPMGTNRGSSDTAFAAQVMNPQLKKNFIKPAYGFAAGFRGRGKK